MVEKDGQKTLKKLAKAEAKAAKKGPSSQGVLPVGQGPGAVDRTSPDRSAEIAEKELALHRWKVIFAAVSALVALVSLIVLLVRS